MRAANTAPEDTLLVGDSAIDLDTAKRGGVSCCLVSYGFGFRHELLEQQGTGVLVASNATELGHAIDAWLKGA